MRIALLAASLLWTMPAVAQETRPIPDDYTPPAAEIAEFEWMTGYWEGTGIGGNRAVENWLPPVGGTMVGSFIQADAEDGIQFTEHMYLMEEDGTVILRVKHFNADFTGWEDAEGMVTFRLLEAEHCAAYFGGLTLRCDGDDGYAVFLLMRNSAGETNELEFRFIRAGPRSQVPTCPEAETTMAMNACLREIFDAAEGERQRYFDAALERYADQGDLRVMLAQAQEAFSAYRDRECEAKFEQYDGTIRTSNELGCMITLTRRRTHDIWRDWLTYPDSTPPNLPEPPRA